MNFKINLRLVLNFFCFFQILFIFLHILTSNILYYIALLIFIPINIFFAFILRRVNYWELFVFILFILLLLFFGIMGGEDINATFVSWFMLVFSLSLVKNMFDKSFIKYIWVLLIAINVYVLYLAYVNGFDPEFGNNILENKSRNYVSGTLAIFTILYLTLCRYFDEKIEIFILILLAVNCLFLYGRSGIIVGVLLLLFGVYYKFGKVFFITVSVIALLFLGVISTYILTQTNFNEGLDTPRTALKNEYLNYIINDPYSFFFGADFQKCCSLISSYGFNPHNSFIMGHSIYGLGSTIAAIIIMIVIILSKRLDFIFLFFILFLRYSLDSIGIFTYYDVVLFSIFYACYLVKRDSLYVK